jgi:hypothetical protein
VVKVVVILVLVIFPEIPPVSQEKKSLIGSSLQKPILFAAGHLGTTTTSKV